MTLLALPQPDSSVKETLPRCPSPGGWAQPGAPGSLVHRAFHHPPLAPSPLPAPGTVGLQGPFQPLLQVGELHDQAAHSVCRIFHAGSFTALDPHSCPGGTGGRTRGLSSQEPRQPPRWGGGLLSLELSIPERNTFDSNDAPSHQAGP